jgi:hypothetical protein
MQQRLLDSFFRYYFDPILYDSLYGNPLKLVANKNVANQALMDLTRPSHFHLMNSSSHSTTPVPFDSPKPIWCEVESTQRKIQGVFQSNLAATVHLFTLPTIPFYTDHPQISFLLIHLPLYTCIFHGRVSACRIEDPPPCFSMGRGTYK